eukprot:TRINITY_DN4208_c0_g1::TRINITY_DN4208_c0_g1_i1::g.7988::m.7988 TRINITY_DN4208_c0_g1::TRINITY_DN4208_c0_g1_i1::g.7988  ORF type:complete len:427 (-),score=100.72 TRINITY_DN4208_c0_g1_i1:432-1676(-)
MADEYANGTPISSGVTTNTSRKYHNSFCSHVLKMNADSISTDLTGKELCSTCEGSSLRPLPTTLEELKDFLVRRKSGVTENARIMSPSRKLRSMLMKGEDAETEKQVETQPTAVITPDPEPVAQPVPVEEKSTPAPCTSTPCAASSSSCSSIPCSSPCTSSLKNLQYACFEGLLIAASFRALSLLYPFPCPTEEWNDSVLRTNSWAIAFSLIGVASLAGSIRYILYDLVSSDSCVARCATNVHSTLSTIAGTVGVMGIVLAGILSIPLPQDAQFNGFSLQAAGVIYAFSFLCAVLTIRSGNPIFVLLTQIPALILLGLSFYSCPLAPAQSIAAGLLSLIVSGIARSVLENNSLPRFLCIFVSWLNPDDVLHIFMSIAVTFLSQASLNRAPLEFPEYPEYQEQVNAFIESIKSKF